MYNEYNHRPNFFNHQYPFAKVIAWQTLTALFNPEICSPYGLFGVFKCIFYQLQLQIRFRPGTKANYRISGYILEIGRWIFELEKCFDATLLWKLWSITWFSAIFTDKVWIIGLYRISGWPDIRPFFISGIRPDNRLEKLFQIKTVLTNKIISIYITDT